MGPPRPRPSSPTTLFRQQILGQSSHQQQQPQPPDASPQALPMPLSATTGARRPPLPPPAVAGSSTSLYVPPARTGGRALRSRPNDVDELGRKPGTVDLPGTSSASASKRRRVEAPAAAAAGPSRRRFIPPPPLPRPGEDPDEEAEPASEYNCPVCLCPPTQAIVTPCGHLLCFACLQKSLAANLIRTGQKPNPLLVQGAAVPGWMTPLNLEGECPVCRVALPGGLFGRVDRRPGKTAGEGVRRIEVKLVDVRPVEPPIELE